MCASVCAIVNVLFLLYKNTIGGTDYVSQQPREMTDLHLDNIQPPIADNIRLCVDYKIAAAGKWARGFTLT